MALLDNLVQLLGGNLSSLQPAAQALSQVATPAPGSGANAPAPSSAAAQAERRKLLLALGQKRGRQSTIMTGPLGVSSQMTRLERPILSAG